MITYVETTTRVFEISIEPDTPGYMRRVASVRIVRGEAMTMDEYKQFSAMLAAEIISMGADLVSMNGIEETEDD